MSWRDQIEFAMTTFMVTGLVMGVFFQAYFIVAVGGLRQVLAEFYCLYNDHLRINLAHWRIVLAAQYEFSVRRIFGLLQKLNDCNNS